MRREWVLVMAVMAVGCLGVSFLGADFPTDTDANQVFLPIAVAKRKYAFLVAGHTYGATGVDNPGVHPPFKSFFPHINSLGLDFGVFTGDIVIYGTANDWDEVEADLDELNMPVHFAVGNHDMTGRDLFVSRYGPTYYSFESHSDLFVVLDSELDQCSIVGDQLTFLENTLDSTQAQNVFIFVHKVLWVAEGTPYYALRDKINGPGGYDFQSNFWPRIVPLLRDLDARVYVIAGDVGVGWAMALFYDEYENIRFVASGMGGAEEENFLVFHVRGGDVHITAYRLDSQLLNLGTVEAYNLAYYAQP